jgi:hypothetical protein
MEQMNLFLLTKVANILRNLSSAGRKTNQ